MLKRLTIGTLSSVLLSTAASVQAAPMLGNELVWQNRPTGSIVSEIVSFERSSNRIFVAAGPRVDVLNASTGELLQSLSVPTGLGTVNSVATSNRGFLAVSVDAAVKTDPGRVLIFDTSTNSLVRSITVGAVPDMITWTPDGQRILVANEAEQAGNGASGSARGPSTVNAEGSVSIIDAFGNDPNAWAVRTAGFSQFNGREAELRAQNIRIFGGTGSRAATAAEDLEPEFIAVNADGTRAFVALQENNALATIDIASGNVVSLTSFGLKNHGLAGNGLDASDRNGTTPNIRLVPGLFGLYQPDGIATFERGGRTFIATANEGDARNDLGDLGQNEEVRAGTLAATLNPAIFPANSLIDNTPESIARLNVTTATPGDVLNANGQRDQLFSFGARSFSFFDDQGRLVWDSGDLLERTVIQLGLFQDGRSDDKGPEPEAIVIAEVSGRLIAFVGLERTNNVLAFDIEDFDPTNAASFVPSLVGNFQVSGLLRPEGLSVFTGLGNDRFLAVAFEGDGAGTRGTALFRVAVPEPASLSVFAASLLALGFAARARRKA